MKFRTTALALLALSSTSLAACSSTQDPSAPPPAASTTTSVPCQQLLPSVDGDLDGNAWAQAVAEHGTLDYVSTRHGYGMVITMDGTPIGYALAEDSTSECALSNGPGYAS